jgi:hypothetical protein
VHGHVLSADELISLTDAVPPDAIAGGRYAAAQLAHLDSEKGAHSRGG